ncbi:hypothetical protein U9M48_037810 [Paspalum notatum var. saurae]|uniref:Poly(A) RNA polymerase mitochondrial-like central palm domain-containing protein n=1 Tax=Paspalum notatum var. saurae TaxID=547442 RepID=A0AAQ3UFR0_PASNO
MLIHGPFLGRKSPRQRLMRSPCLLVGSPARNRNSSCLPWRWRLTRTPAAAADLHSMAAAAAAATAPVSLEPETSPLQGLVPLPSPRPSDAIPSDSQALLSQAERCEMESEACVMDTALFPTLESLLQGMYTSLVPEPVDYENRHAMIKVFNTIVGQIFGEKDGLPIVEAFGSFTMDLFTPKSDLDLSVNFNSDNNDQYPRGDKISAIKSLAKVLRSRQSFYGRKRFHGVSPILSARVPVLKAIDRETGVECDISVENKDGMSRSMILKFISSIDERFQKLCYLIKFWAKVHDVNSPKDQTMSSMAIISLVAFHLQTRRPPILPAFSTILKDGSDFASIEKNVLPFKGFGQSNKESIAELFVSLMSKLVSVEGLWEQGLCASNFEGSWISKTWQKGVGSLSVEDFLDRSQNFARAVGAKEMQKICGCLRAAVSDLNKFFTGEIDAPKLKALLFEPVSHAKPEAAADPIQKTVKRKRVNPNKTGTNPSLKNAEKKKKKPLEDGSKKSSSLGNSQAQQKKTKITAHTTSRSGKATSASAWPPTRRMHWSVPTQPIIHEFSHIPPHVIVPPAFGYGLPPPHLPPAYPHPRQGLLGQPHGNFPHFNPGMHQGQAGLIGPSPAHHPLLHGFHHPYGVNGVPHIDRRLMMPRPPPPYGMGPGFWR